MKNLVVAAISPSHIKGLSTAIVREAPDLEKPGVHRRYTIRWVALLSDSERIGNCFIVCGACEDDPNEEIGIQISFQPNIVPIDDFRFIDPFEMHLPGTAAYWHVRRLAQRLDLPFEQLLAAALAAAIQQPAVTK